MTMEVQPVGLSGPNLGSWGVGATLVAAWLVLVAATAFYRADFLSHQTLLAVTFTMSIVGILAVAQALIAISGGLLDLSQPTGLLLASLVAVRLTDMQMPIAFAALAAIAVGVLWGLCNATIVVFGKLNPIIVTLATNFIGLAALYLVFQSAQMPIRSDLNAFGRATVLGLPAIFWPMVAVVIVAGYLLPRTRYGRHAVATGGNPMAARARGISLRRVRFGTFAVSGALVGLAAILFSSSVGPFNTGSANSFQLSVIVVVILAGISLAGGRGHLWVLLPSIGFLSTLPTSLVFFGLSSDWQMIVQGTILVIAISIDGYRMRRRAR